MAKFLAWITGRLTEVQPITTSAGAGDASKMIQTDSNGLLDASLMPSGITADQITANANGTISAKDLVYMEAAGTIARASGAAAGNQAMGWATSSVTTGQPVTMQLEGKISGLTGLTAGSRYYLSDVTPGGLLIAPGPSGSGKLAQYVGSALSTTVLNFEPDDAVLLV